MEIRNGLTSLNSLLGVNSPDALREHAKSQDVSATGGGLIADRATLSSTAGEIANAASDPGVRMDKVSAIQSDLAAGTYDIPASAVATKIVDAMLGGK